MTGCGAGGAMVGGKLAAETVMEAAERGKNDIASLWSYDHKWFVESGRGSHYAGLTAIRNSLQSLNHEEISFLFRKYIFSGEMMTASVSGIFQVPDLRTTAGILLKGMTRPGLLLKLNSATTIGTKILKHYQQYPKVWEASAFEKWSATAEKLFLKTV